VKTLSDVECITVPRHETGLRYEKKMTKPINRQYYESCQAEAETTIRE